MSGYMNVNCKDSPSCLTTEYVSCHSELQKSKKRKKHVLYYAVVLVFINLHHSSRAKYAPEDTRTIHLNDSSSYSTWLLFQEAANPGERLCHQLETQVRPTCFDQTASVSQPSSWACQRPNELLTTLHRCGVSTLILINGELIDGSSFPDTDFLSFQEVVYFLFQLNYLERRASSLGELEPSQLTVMKLRTSSLQVRLVLAAPA